ncbi:transposase [Duganella sp. FT3S]|uniref:Transposase n=1 Tax=Rugamonas fusca TaxID=2758568 RepID=A0A7W2ELR8_9BURK|nr:transposase [Rugamonas fusca]MBA5608080.1 transposase [Rugamonas fusca]
MPRHARIILANVPIHLVQRGHNRQACFFADADYQTYQHLLRDHTAASDCALHAYALMGNHVHLLLSSATPAGPATLMKAVNQRYVRYINKKYQRTGTLWQGRFHSSLTEEPAYFFACHRYIELNPVRAGVVAHPAHYRWSSYRANAEGASNPLLQAHPLYDALGDSPDQRQRTYRELFAHELQADVLAQIRQASNGNYALGTARYTTQLRQALGPMVMPGKSGRPANSTPR